MRTTAFYYVFVKLNYQRTASRDCSVNRENKGFLQVKTQIFFFFTAY